MKRAGLSICFSMCLAAVSTVFHPVHTSAQEPSIRFFAQFAGSAADCADWEGPASKRLVAHKQGNDAAVLEFGKPDQYNGWYPGDFQVYDGEGELIFDFTGTTWVQVSVVHITEDGVEKIENVFWLKESADDKPANGLTCATGPQGEAMAIMTVSLGRIDDASPQDGKLYVQPVGGSAGTLCVSAAIFNK